jgi:hypothetical protein
MHQLTMSQTNGAKMAWWSALWTWTTNDQRSLPPVANVMATSPLDLRDVQPGFMFDPRIVTAARLPWDVGQPPPPALMPPAQRLALPWWRRLSGGLGR